MDPCSRCNVTVSELKASLDAQARATVKVPSIRPDQWHKYERTLERVAERVKKAKLAYALHIRSHKAEETGEKGAQWAMLREQQAKRETVGS